jgi:hypothetical protein
MMRAYRFRTAWMSYAAIQALWVLVVLLTPLAAVSHPSRFWVLPLCAITVVSGVHMMIFWLEYNALLRRLIQLFPPSRHLLRYLIPHQKEPWHFVPLGAAYALAGALPAVLILLS